MDERVISLSVSCTGIVTRTTEFNLALLSILHYTALELIYPMWIQQWTSYFTLSFSPIGLNATCWTYAWGGLHTHPFAFICVCVVKFNQGSIWASLMGVIVLSARLCVWADRESV